MPHEGSPFGGWRAGRGNPPEGGQVRWSGNGEAVGVLLAQANEEMSNVQT